MYAEEEGKGSSVSVEVLADGHLCKEHALSLQDEVQECWIVVKTGQNLRIKVDLSIASRQYEVDLNVDGVLRNIWVADSTDQDEMRSNLIAFSEGVHRSGRSLRRSKLAVGGYKLDSILSKDVSAKAMLAIGVVEIVIYRYDHGRTGYRVAKSPEIHVAKDHKTFLPDNQDVKPTHQIRFLNSQALSKTERDAWRCKESVLPPGDRPFAVFRYKIRSEQALKKAQLLGITYMPKSKHPIPPAIPIMATSNTDTLIKAENVVADGNHPQQPLSHTSVTANAASRQGTTASEAAPPTGGKRSREDGHDGSHDEAGDPEDDASAGPSMPHSLKRRKEHNEVLKGQISRLQEELAEAKKHLDNEKQKTEELRTKLEWDRDTLKATMTQLEQDILKAKANAKVEQARELQASIEEETQETARTVQTVLLHQPSAD